MKCFYRNRLFTRNLLFLLCIKFILSKENHINFKQIAGFINVDTSILPTTVNAISQYSFIIYPNSRILNSDSIVVAFPYQVLLTDGQRNCQAVNIAIYN
jgi:hypothetical protein